MKVIIINGAGGCGKDTFVQFFRRAANHGEKLPFLDRVLNISTVDYIKDVAKKLGWEGQKDNDSRKYLSELKEMATYWGDIPFKDMKTKVTQFYSKLSNYDMSDEGYVFIHCREPEQIDHLKADLGFPCYSLLIRRPTQEKYGNHSDDDVENYAYDYAVNNYGTLEELDTMARAFLKALSAE